MRGAFDIGDPSSLTEAVNKSTWWNMAYMTIHPQFSCSPVLKH